jgi:potassium-transporting ATPase KdpC subunit
MWKPILIAIRISLVTLLLTGVAYPLAITGLGQVMFAHRANGSIVTDDHGNAVGSELIAQGFANPAYLQPRPSAAGTNGYDPTSSSGSNLGPTSQKLRDRATADLERLRKENPEAQGPVPAELVTASGSGLDPDVSPETAYWQVPRIARARGVSPDRVRSVIDSQVEGRDLGLFGEPHVNVLLVNLALDRQFTAPAPLPAPSASGSAAPPPPAAPSP